jgi:protein SCO1/2
MTNRILRILTVSAVGVILGSGVAWYQVRSENAALPQIEPAAGKHSGTHAATETPVGGSFSLTDHNGVAVTEKTYPGYKLMFFGFTHCPDICPLGLQKMSATLEALGEDGKDITPIFVTIDPARDTPDVLKSYLSVYDERLVGLTGTEEQVKAVSESFRVYSAKVQTGDHAGHYSVDHSGFTYLLRDDGTMVTVFGGDDKPSEIAKEIREILKQS